MNNKTVKTFMVVAIIFTLSLYFIGGTYARYTGDFNGNAKVDVAEWKVQIHDKGAEETNLDLTFTPTENENVVDGKIAPGSTSKANVQIDLTGTEVAVDLIVEVTDESLNSALQQLGLNNKEITFESNLTLGTSNIQKSGSGSSSDPYVITLPENGAYTGDDTLKLELTLKWKNEENNNTTDTEAGKKAQTSGTITIPVKMTVKQHIDAE